MSLLGVIRIHDTWSFLKQEGAIVKFALQSKATAKADVFSRVSRSDHLRLRSGSGEQGHQQNELQVVLWISKGLYKWD